MSTTTFSSPAGVNRDRWGRPLIIPEIGGKPEPYTRISTLCKALEDSSSLNNYYGRMTALGVARNAALLAQASSLTRDPGDKKQLNDLVDSAMNIAGAHDAREMGTALHRLAELVDTGGDLTHMQPAQRNDIDAYVEATKNVTMLAAERFVVVDEVKAAGTFDRLVQLPDGRIVVADIKTGATAPDYPLSIAVQTGLYARGKLYDATSGTRTPLTGVETDIALLIHLPAGTGTCNLYLLDTRSALAAAQIAVSIREWRKQKLATPFKP